MWDLRIADARALPFDNKCAHMCVTSPPYFGLRDYGHAGQIGLEGNIEDFVNELVGVFREVRRVLRDDGTLWLNLGDSYTERQMLGIPWRVALALQSDGWILRQEIIWHKTNPMPEPDAGRFTRAHEQIFLLAKSKDYFFDSEAVKVPCAPKTLSHKGGGRTAGAQANSDKTGKAASGNWGKITQARRGSKKVPRKSVWAVSRESWGKHLATYPEKLAEPCILAGSPEGGTVLDPFTGSGTTGAVAIKHGRLFIGTEINPEYGDLARERMTRALEASGRATAENTGPEDRVQLGLNL